MQHYVKGQLYKAKSGAVFMLWDRKDDRGRKLYGAQWLFNGIWLLDGYSVTYNRAGRDVLLHQRLADSSPVDWELFEENKNYGKRW